MAVRIGSLKMALLPFALLVGGALEVRMNSLR
jgi:hypothetical protein